MNKVILVAHGKLAHEMKNSAEMIFGGLPNFESVEGLDTIQEKITAAMQDDESSYLILTDLFCGTPYNASCAVAMKNPEREIDVVSGMSLPVVLEVASMLGNSLQDIVNHATSIPCDTVKAFKQQVIEEEEDL